MTRLLAVVVLVVLLASPAQSDGVDVDGDSGDASTVLKGVRDYGGSSNSPGPISDDPVTTSTKLDQPPPNYQWLLACSENRPGQPMTDCGSAQACPKETESLWVLWSRPANAPDADWTPLTSECYQKEPPIPDQPPRPTVTPGMVEEAVRRLGLPGLPLQVQPADATLVNFDTIFYTEPQPFDHSVTLVGFDVRVVAEPVSYGWWFGDGATLTTGIPGAPYPAKDVIHRYDDAHVTVEPSVDVTYQVRYSVDGGEFQQLETTLTAEGPPTGLRIREATPLLAGTD